MLLARQQICIDTARAHRNQRREITDSYVGVAGPFNPSPVCATSGKPSTWFPLGGLVDQAQRKNAMHSPPWQMHYHVTYVKHDATKIVISTMSCESQIMLV